MWTFEIFVKNYIPIYKQIYGAWRYVTEPSTGIIKPEHCMCYVLQVDSIEIAKERAKEKFHLTDDDIIEIRCAGRTQTPEPRAHLQ
jgi:hypothetical protein